jgi:hypothetical protein
MAYVSVAQNEHETALEDPENVPAASPTLPGFSHRPLSLDFRELSGEIAVIDPTANNGGANSQGVGNILKSLTSSSKSYEMVEEDDYEDQVVTPRGLNFAGGPLKRPALDRDNTVTGSDLHPVRTASISRNLPMNHPKPDLQSMQGAYVKNVERLEESAERLSIASSHDDELRRIRSIDRKSSVASSTGSRHGRPARQFSTSSYAASIIGMNSTARNGGYSPSGYITSPVGSIHSVHRNQNGSLRGRTSGSRRVTSRSQDPKMVDSPTHVPEVLHLEHDHDSLPEAYDDSHSLAPSNNTNGHQDDPFQDFDGSHYNSRPASMRRISLQHPPLARDSRAFKEAQPGEKMIYYPAPVPVMLNLPSRLSRMNFTDREKRRLQALSGMPEEMRKSAAWLSSENLASPERRNLAAIPPQLRASAFFDQPGATTDLALKNGSAVQTLDSILDAAAHAPVSAFTDHPIVGHLGREVYGVEKSSRKSVQPDKETKKKRRSSLSNMLKTRRSSGQLGGHGRITSRESKALDMEDGTSGDELERAAANSIAPGDDEVVQTPLGDESGSEAESSESEHQPGFSGAPTTLLAELQMRKTAQKERNRTAADAFPNGMHSTLLELDAVTQLQQKSRKQKHVTLAWEDHEAADKENFDDEDVPLGMLFPEKERSNQANVNRPIGLMEKREMEENEPLSHRRARLRGEPIQIPRAQSMVASQPNNEEDDSSKYKIDLPGMSGADLDEPEEETLGQRMKRMKEEREKVSAGNFASDVASQLGLQTEDTPEPSKTPEAEETLGQRRKRLKDAAAKQYPGVSSMGDLLLTNPIGYRQTSTESQKARPGALPRFNTIGPTQSQLPPGFSMPQLPPHMASIPYYNRAPYMNPMGNMYGYKGGMHPMADLMGPPLDNRQRAVIDRWRQGVPGGM